MLKLTINLENNNLKLSDIQEFKNLYQLKNLKL